MSYLLLLETDQRNCYDESGQIVSCSGSGQGGETNIRELESLVDLNCHSPALESDHPFEHTAEGYWSATTSIYETRYAWVLYPRDGAVGVGYKPLREFCASAVRNPS
jgi:hypothetical protein